MLLFTLLIPVSTILLGATILGEHPKPENFAGMALIGLGLEVIDGQPLDALRRRLARIRARRGGHLGAAHLAGGNAVGGAVGIGRQAAHIVFGGAAQDLNRGAPGDRLGPSAKAGAFRG